MKLTLIIPAYNEEENIGKTVLAFYEKLNEAKIEHEILVINDNSKDKTLDVLKHLESNVPTLRHLTNTGLNGYGYAVRKGLMSFTGDCVAVAMADLSDDPNDLINFYRTMKIHHCDMVFGSRWTRKSIVTNYPLFKLFINRAVNNVIKLVFMFNYNDVTNGFKLFSREVIDGTQPFLTGQFSFALELPLKAIIRGYNYKVVSNNWYNREIGTSNLNLRKMFPRYAYVVFYCIVEKLFSVGDFKKGKFYFNKL